MAIRQVPPSIKDPNLSGFLRELRAAIGGVSDQVTKLVQTRASSGGGGGTDPGGGGTDPGTNPPTGDGYPPAAPLSLEAVPGAFSITLVWTNPVISDLQATEVWARRSFSAWNATFEYLANAKVLVNGVVYRSRRAQSISSATNVVTLNKNFPPATSPEWWEATTLSATERRYVGESAGNTWIHDNLTPGETWAYWVRNRDIETLFSSDFPDNDVGVITTTLLDPGAYLDLLTNSITATQLFGDLGRRINLIDGPDALVGSVNQRTSAVYNELDGVIEDIVDGTTDITVQTPSGFSSLRALKTSTESSSAAIVQLNTVNATSTSANVQQLLGLKGQVDHPTTGLPAAQGYIAQLNTIDVTSTSANVQALLGLRGQVNDETTGLPKAVANINAINDIRVTSTSANARAVATLDATVNNGPDSLSGKIAALNNVSADSTSANASALFQVQASNATKVRVFFQNDTPPTTSRTVGDLWYDADDNNKEYRWNGSSWVVYRTATKTFSQTIAPTNTTANPLYPGDLWIDTTVESVNSTNVPRNRTHRWSGSAWVDVSNGTFSEAKANALVTNLEQTKIGYSTRNDTNQVWDADGFVKNKETADAWNAGPNTPKVTWNVGLPLATATKQVSVTANNGQTASLQQQFEAIYGTGGLRAQYTVKIDVDGWVSGFGLASTAQADGTAISDFGIRADRFWIAPPTNPGNLNGLGIPLLDLGGGLCIAVTNIVGPNGGSNYYGYFRTNSANDLAVGDFFTLRDIRASAVDRVSKHAVWNASFVVAGVGNYTFVDYRFGYAETRSTSSLDYLGGNATHLVVVALTGYKDFGYHTNSSTPPNDGRARLVSDKYLPFVVTTTPQYYNGVTIDPGVYMNAAFIVDASITNAKIFGHICSADYNGSTANPQATPGTVGWCINKNGQAVFNSGVWRNYLRSQTFNGTFNSGGIITGNGTAGWAMDQNGTAVFNDVIVRKPGNISNFSVTRADGFSGTTARGISLNAERGIPDQPNWGEGYVTLPLVDQPQAILFTVNAALQAQPSDKNATVRIRIQKSQNGSTWTTVTSQNFGVLGATILPYSYAYCDKTAYPSGTWYFRASVTFVSTSDGATSLSLTDRSFTVLVTYR